MPLNVLVSQGAIYTVLLSAFVLLPNVNSSYWLLSALSAQFALLYYVLLFSAAIKLFFSVEQSKFHAFLGVVLPLIAGLVSLIGILVGFMPPSNVSAANVFRYECFMIISLVVFCLIPFFILKRKTWEAKTNSEELLFKSALKKVGTPVSRGFQALLLITSRVRNGSHYVL